MTAAVTTFIPIALILIAVAVALVAVPLLRSRGNAPGAPIAATVAAVAIPALAVLMYVGVSNHDWNAAPTAPAPVAGGNNGGEIPEIVLELERRLATMPGDAEGWLLLARTYMQLQRLPEARRAYAAALAAEPANEAKLGLAEIDILTNRANLAGDAGRLVEEVLAAEPENPKALFYGGMVSLMRGNQAQVRERWQKLLAMSPPDGVRQVLEQQLAQLDGAELAAPPPVQVATSDSAIAVSVSVADALAARYTPNAILFVLARQPGVPGPPIAAVRVSASSLPAVLEVSDADAMLAGRTLAGLGEIEIVARISNGGGPIASPGDLYGDAVWKAADGNGRAVEISIDRIVE